MPTFLLNGSEAAASAHQRKPHYLQLWFLCSCILGMASIPVAFAQNEAAIRKSQFNIENGLALQGYDPISYFSGKPQEGKKDWTCTWQGITYRFANAANLATFKKTPQTYEPAYGGWCAYAMGNSGEKVEVDPETYKILNGRLYLFYNKLFTNTLPKWNKDEGNLKKKADAYWLKYVH